MGKTKNELEEKLKKLSPKIRAVIFWTKDNIDFVNHIYRGKAIPKEKWGRYRELAIIKEDNLRKERKSMT